MPAAHAALNATQAIVKHHAALGLSSHADAQAAPADATPFEIAYAAARRLGFMAADAQCLARAWQCQSERTGRFDPHAWPCAAADFGLEASASSQDFAPEPMALGVYAVLPSAAWVGRMACAGLRTLQLRFKSADARAVDAEIRAAIDAVAGSGARLYINDHWRQAMAAGAYGVHLGQEDLDQLSSADLARIRAAGLRLGLSTHGYAEMLRAAALGPSYVAMGAVFPTTLKAMTTPAQGVARLGMYVRLLRHKPVVAIGGIGPDNLHLIAKTGAGSIAVVSAITAATDPPAAALQLQRLWEQERSSADEGVT